MADQARVWWEKIRIGLWPVPLAMMIAGVGLFALAMHLDGRVSDGAALRSWWLRSGSGDDARNLLSTVVTAIITMSSVVFSITIVALSLAATQFGSRLVRTYMADVKTKLALGLFALTVMYCLLALRSVSVEMPAADVPHVTVTLGLALGVVCVLTLLLFLHRVAGSLVADQVISRVVRDLEESIAELEPIEAGKDHATPAALLPGAFDRDSVSVASVHEGYVRAIEHQRLVELAGEHRFVLRLSFGAGAFICKGDSLGRVWPAQALSPSVERAIHRAVLVGATRTATQDIEYSMRHLVDVALRALSAAINDANTALVVIDRLRGALSLLMGRALPQAIYRDQAGIARVLGIDGGYGDVLDAGWSQIRRAAGRHPEVIVAMLAAIGRIAEHVRLREQGEALAEHARLIAAAGLRGLDEASDRALIEAAWRDAVQNLDESRRRLGGGSAGLS